jgi:hypothetical protein
VRADRGEHDRARRRPATARIARPASSGNIAQHWGRRVRPHVASGALSFSQAG